MTLILITVLSLTIAVVMSLVAWRLARDERRRSEARVEALASEIHGEPSSPVAVSDLFFAESRPRTSGPLRALGIGVLVVGSLLALVVFASSPRSGPAATTQPPVAEPVSLVALGHERDGERLIVRGVVRSPAPTVDSEPLVAVVSVLNRQGDIVASGSAPVRGATLTTPNQAAVGVESIFVVTVPGVSDVSRYRVGFKRNERVVAHVDRRGHGELP